MGLSGDGARSGDARYSRRGYSTRKTVRIVESFSRQDTFYVLRPHKVPAKPHVVRKRYIVTRRFVSPHVILLRRRSKAYEEAGGRSWCRCPREDTCWSSKKPVADSAPCLPSPSSKLGVSIQNRLHCSRELRVCKSWSWTTISSCG